MAILFAGVLVLLDAPASQAAGNAKVYVAYTFGGGVAVVDPGTLEAWGVIKPGEGPSKLRATPDGKLVFVTLSGENKVKVIDTSTDGIVGTIEVGGIPYEMELTPDGKLLFVCNTQSNSVSVVDVKELKEINKINTLGSPYVVKISPDGGLLYIVNGDKPMQVVDLKTMKTLAEVDIPKEVSKAALSPDGKLLYLNSLTDGEITIMDRAKLQTIGKIKAGTDGLAVSPDGKELWFGGGDRMVVVYSLVQDKVVAKLPRDTDTTGLVITFSPDGKSVIAGPAGQDENMIYVFDAVKKEKTGEVKVERGIEGILYLEKK